MVFVYPSLCIHNGNTLWLSECCFIFGGKETKKTWNTKLLCMYLRVDGFMGANIMYFVDYSR